MIANGSIVRFLPHLIEIRASHNPKVAGSNPAPRYLERVAYAALFFVQDPRVYSAKSVWLGLRRCGGPSETVRDVARCRFVIGTNGAIC